MKKSFISIFCIIAVLEVSAQTLYVPGGTAGIGTSVNSNIGIGTSSPISKLDIRGHVYLPFSNQLCLGNINDNGNRLKLFNNNQNAYIDYYNSLFFRSGSTSNTTYFTFTSDGKFGIGTTTPTDRFQIGSGTAKLCGGAANGGANLGWGNSYLGFNAARNNGIWYFDTDGANNGGSIIYGDISGAINFLPVASSGGTARTLTDAQVRVLSALRILSDGRVIAKDFEVTLTGWPDFVFEPDYKLKTLDELDSFIKNERHLPGIPQAGQIENNTLKLGEMNKLLLQKVEELTLYVIQLSKENKELSSRLTEIEQSNEKQ